MRFSWGAHKESMIEIGRRSRCAADVQETGPGQGKGWWSKCDLPIRKKEGGPCVVCGHGGGEDDEHGVGVGISQTFCADCITGQDDDRVYPDEAYHDYDPGVEHADGEDHGHGAIAPA